MAGDAPVAWRAALSDCARTRRTGFAGAVRLSGDVVDALENACKELPEIIRIMLASIDYREVKSKATITATTISGYDAKSLPATRLQILARPQAATRPGSRAGPLTPRRPPLPTSRQAYKVPSLKPHPAASGRT